jgi:hypothetical protein
LIRIHQPGEIPQRTAALHPVEAAYIRQFEPVGTQSLIRNVNTRILALEVGDTLMPISVDSPRPGNCYVVSPSTAYTDYANYELEVLPNRALRVGLRSLIAAVNRCFQRVRLDRVVHVNNWMLSTNLYGSWQGSGLPELTAEMISRYPDKAIVFRSVNPFTNGELIARLNSAGYLLLPSRRIYFQDAREGDARSVTSHRDYRHDARLLKRSGYRICRPDADAGPELFDRLETLYNRLYLEKYTPLNPHFTSQWMRNGCRDAWLNLICLVSTGGSLDGVAGYVQRGDTMTNPVFGYETALPQSVGLYRMLSWICTNEAIERRLALNCSAGAAAFKRSRGAVPHTEYCAVYAKHLDFERKLAWSLLSVLLNRFAAPLLRRFEL